jgi:hypothetical protein
MSSFVMLLLVRRVFRPACESLLELALETFAGISEVSFSGLAEGWSMDQSGAAATFLGSHSLATFPSLTTLLSQHNFASLTTSTTTSNFSLQLYPLEDPKFTLATT